MATTTSNLGLTKPSYSDTADIATINGNMDILDRAVNAVENGIAVIANGNSHSALSTGDFVYVRGHGTLAEGLYKALSNIAANATLTSSNLSSVSGGLGAEVSSLNSKMSYKAEIIQVSLSATTPRTITFSSYNTSALIGFAANNQGNAGLYIYSNGYLNAIKQSENTTLTVSSDYKTITCSTTYTGNYLLFVIAEPHTAFSIT